VIPALLASASRALPKHTWTVLLCVSGVCLLLLSIALMLAHAAAFHDMQEALPLAARIPSLETRLAVLSEQVELSELHAAMSTRSAEEKVHLYVLPDNVDLTRVLGFLEVLRDHVKVKKMLTTMSGIDVGEEVPVVVDGNTTLRAVPFTFSATVNDEGLHDLLETFALTGISTISDALTEEQYTELFRATEAENPAGILALERFLSTDFLIYTKDQRATEETLLKSFSSQEFRETLETIKQSSLLSKGVQMMESEFGTALGKNRLWPLPLLTVEDSAWSESGDGWHHVTLTVFAYAYAR